MYINQNVSLRQGGRKAPKGGKERLEILLEEEVLYTWIGEFKSSKQFYEDCKKIDFSMENVNPAKMHTTKSGIDYLAFTTGGDWELPLLVILYWDGKHYRGYVPIKGNVINMNTKSAFGNDNEEDFKFLNSQGFNLKSEYDLENIDLKPNADMCFEDFEARIEVI